MMAANKITVVVIIFSVLATMLLQMCSAAPYYPPKTFTNVNLPEIDMDDGSGSGSGSGDVFSDDEDYGKEASGSGQESRELTAEQVWKLFWDIVNKHGMLYTDTN